MGAAAQVHEAQTVAVGADRARIPAGLCRELCVEADRGLDAFDDLAFVRLVGENLEAFGDGVLFAHERLRLGDDRLHLSFDPFQVVLGEAGAFREIEVVVEAVRDGRTDGVARSGPEPEHGLGHDVCGRMAQYLAALVAVGGDDAHRGALGKGL